MCNILKEELYSWVKINCLDLFDVTKTPTSHSESYKSSYFSYSEEIFVCFFTDVLFKTKIVQFILDCTSSGHFPSFDGLQLPKGHAFAPIPHIYP